MKLILVAGEGEEEGGRRREEGDEEERERGLECCASVACCVH